MPRDASVRGAPGAGADSRTVASGYLAALVIANLVAKFLLIRLNQADYTDGIIQITIFENS
jgi:hypothetical protein